MIAEEEGGRDCEVEGGRFIYFKEWFLLEGRFFFWDEGMGVVNLLGRSGGVENWVNFILG